MEGAFNSVRCCVCVGVCVMYSVCGLYRSVCIWGVQCACMGGIQCARGVVLYVGMHLGVWSAASVLCVVYIVQCVDWTVCVRSRYIMCVGCIVVCGVQCSAQAVYYSLWCAVLCAGCIV